MHYKSKDGIHVTARDAILNMCRSPGGGPGQSVTHILIEIYISRVIALSSVKYSGRVETDVCESRLDGS